VPCDVLKHTDSGSKNANGVGDVGENGPLIVFPLAATGVTVRLAGVATSQNIHTLHQAPVYEC
jgi:hypothetical protein